MSEGEGGASKEEKGQKKGRMSKPICCQTFLFTFNDTRTNRNLLQEVLFCPVQCNLKRTFTFILGMNTGRQE